MRTRVELAGQQDKAWAENGGARLSHLSSGLGHSGMARWNGTVEEEQVP